jgi:hypothetical protein
MAFSASNFTSKQLALQGSSSLSLCLERLDQHSLDGVQPSLEVTTVVSATQPLLLSVKLEAKSDSNISDLEEESVAEAEAESDSDYTPSFRKAVKRRRVDDEPEDVESQIEQKTKQATSPTKFLCPGNHSKDVTGCKVWPLNMKRYCQVHYAAKAAQVFNLLNAKFGPQGVVAGLRSLGI